MHEVYKYPGGPQIDMHERSIIMTKLKFIDVTFFLERKSLSNILYCVLKKNLVSESK